jgi:hypothetical protein
MGKGMKPKQGYNQKKYESNYDEINWSKTRKKKSQNEIHTKQQNS